MTFQQRLSLQLQLIITFPSYKSFSCLRMLRSCRKSLPKHVEIWRINPQHRLVLAAHLQTWQGLTGDQAVIAPPKVLNSVGLHQQTAKSYNVLPSLECNSRLPGERERQVKVPVTVASIDDFFTQLSRMLADGNVSGTTLWHFVKKGFPRHPSADTS